MRHQAATVHELARVAELSVLPGETLTKLARELERHELGPGEGLDAGEQFAVVLGGLLTDRRRAAPGRPGSGHAARAHSLGRGDLRQATYDDIVGAWT